MADPLTRQQQEIQEDLRAIVEELGFDYENILETKKEYRSIALHRIRVTMIRGVIVEKYVMIDERLSSVICRFFFSKNNFIPLWKTKRFAFFNYYILEKMSLREKFVLAKAIRKMPNAVADAIERINAARNIVAHNFFPENVRDLRIKKSGRSPSIPILYPYKGVNVFTHAGLKLFLEDVDKVVAFVPYPRIAALNKPRKAKRPRGAELSTLTAPPDAVS
jgi:hypothetical protein